MWLAKYWWLLPLAPLPVLAAAAALIVPLHARRRGHGFVSWFVLQFIVLNPIYPLILVAVLPNKARMRLRAEYEQDLDDRLREAGVIPRRAVGLVGPGSVEDRSVGDLPTRL